MSPICLTLYFKSREEYCLDLIQPPGQLATAYAVKDCLRWTLEILQHSLRPVPAWLAHCLVRHQYIARDCQNAETNQAAQLLLLQPDCYHW